MNNFKLLAPYQPTGDQPRAIKQLAESIKAGNRSQTLIGVTGSGKTFTAANIIEQTGLPTLVISHNKTLAAQLYQELKEFFPQNSVHYFVSYYDYYQPEAYIPQTDTYIAKDAKINDLIDSLRHAATASILSRPDTIIVASVSCIYGLGDPAEYQRASLKIKIGEKLTPREFAKKLTLLQYRRNAIDPNRGEFRVRGGIFEIYTPSGEEIVRIIIDGNNVIDIATNKNNFSPQTENYKLPAIRIFPAKHFMPPQKKLALALANIRQELKAQLAYFEKENKWLEAQRLEERVNYDLEMIKQMGYVSGIENYSRHLDFREPGEPPFTLLDYFRAVNRDFMTIIDESHATIPQLRGMFHGDRSRKETLIKHGFRLPSAADNRPLTFGEFEKKTERCLYMSATPERYELEKSRENIAEQIIRPTGLLDPEIEIRPAKNQIADAISEIKKRCAKKERSLVITLTKRMAEDITEFLKDKNIKTAYIHSDIKTLERPEILKNLRLGNFDVLVGVNLLREGLDLPEVSFIAVLDADQEGFLRNETTLLQIIGRAARHIKGFVIMYADKTTLSIKNAMQKTERRRKIQHRYNELNEITPQPIIKAIRKSIIDARDTDPNSSDSNMNEPPFDRNNKKFIAGLEREMKKAAKNLDFELAAKIRNQIAKLKNNN